MTLWGVNALLEIISLSFGILMLN